MADRETPSQAGMFQGIYGKHRIDLSNYEINRQQLIEGVPARLFKFVKRRYMNGALATGSIRLGTLHDFRKTEDHGQSQGDPSEGKNNVFQHVGFLDSHDPSSFAGRIVVLSDGATMENCTLVEERDFPDSYVFCASTNFSEDLFRKWNTSDGLDACYEISDVAGFINAISNALDNSAQLVGYAPVVYVDGDLDGAAGQHVIHPAFVKQVRKYKWQTEYRFVWQHKRPEEADPKLFEVNGLSRCCKPFAILEHGEIMYLDTPAK